VEGRGASKERPISGEGKVRRRDDHCRQICVVSSFEAGRILGENPHKRGKWSHRESSKRKEFEGKRKRN